MKLRLLVSALACASCLLACNSGGTIDHSSEAAGGLAGAGNRAAGGADPGGQGNGGGLRNAGAGGGSTAGEAGTKAQAGAGATAGHGGEGNQAGMPNPAAGPNDCAEPCANACQQGAAIDADCASCIDDVCAPYQARADAAPDRDQLHSCLTECASDSSCPDDCCGQYPLACAWVGTLDMCTCGFPQDDCGEECATNCSDGGFTAECGVCASQSPCSLSAFEYLFAPNRLAHQDCVNTCAASSMSMEECLSLCRNDQPEAGQAYTAFLACACKS